MDTELKPCEKCGHDVYKHSSEGCHYKMTDGYYCACAISIQELMQSEIDSQAAKIERLRSELLLVLDQVDYTSGACRANEMIGGVLDQSVIVSARDALKGGGK